MLRFSVDYRILFQYILYILKFFFFLALSYYLVLKMDSDYTIEYEAKILDTKSWAGEIYYSNSENLYEDIKQKAIKYKKIKNKYQINRIKVPNNHTVSLRLDPLTSTGKIEIKNFQIKYKKQIYKINFKDIEKFPRHDLKILKSNETWVSFEAIGKDPHITLTNNISFNHFDKKDYINIFFLATFFFILFEILLNVINRYRFEQVMVLMMIIIYSLYTIFFSHGLLGVNLLNIFAFISLMIFLNTGIINKFSYIKVMSIFIVYTLMCYIGMKLAYTQNGTEYFDAKIFLIGLSFFIPIGAYKIKNFDLKFFKVGVTVVFVVSSIFILILTLNIININKITVFDFPMWYNNWTQKNYIFWYIILLFGTLSFYNFRDKKDFFMILFMLEVAYYAIFNSYSESARVAFGAGVFLYFILSIFKIKKIYLYIFIWLLTLYIVFSPIIFSLIDLAQYHSRLVPRDALYKTSAALIKENWLFGYGFGGTLNIHIKDIVDASDLPKNYINSFMGGHPHNLSLLFWLEFGIFGAIFLAYFIHQLLKRVVDISYDYISLPAMFGMIIAFDVITSFSWSIWYPQVLLTFTFFGVMLVLSMNIKKERNQGNIWAQN